MSIQPVEPDSLAAPQLAGKAAESFLEIAGRTPAERIRAALLEKLRLTEEQLQNMDPDARKAIRRSDAG
jgi:hypothetical protein